MTSNPESNFGPTNSKIWSDRTLEGIAQGSSMDKGEWYQQSGFDLRFEWGLEGAERISAELDVSAGAPVLREGYFCVEREP